MLGAALYGAADVEGPHRQLGAGFADRLRGNDADGFADVDRCAASQIASVAPAADPFLQGAGQDAADADGFEVGGFYLNAGFLFDHYSRLDQGFARCGVFDVFGGATAKDLVRQRRDDIAAIDHGADGHAGLGLAVFGDDDAVLGDVDQAPGQIPRISGL